MSGHSKWSTIKHKKAATDVRRGQLFSKLARKIIIAAGEKGGDPNTNTSLKQAIDEAKAANMPLANIERAIKKGTGEEKGEALEEVLYEAYGPAGVAILITGITDNKNRTSSEIKKILSDHGAKLGGPGSASFMFRKEGADFVPNTPIQVSDEDKQKLKKLFEALDDHEDVQEIYSNADM